MVNVVNFPSRFLSLSGVYQIAVKYGTLDRVVSLDAVLVDKLSMATYFYSTDEVRVFTVCDMDNPAEEATPLPTNVTNVPTSEDQITIATSEAPFPLITYIVGVVIFSAFISATCIVSGAWGGCLWPRELSRDSAAAYRKYRAAHRLPIPRLPLNPPPAGHAIAESTQLPSGPESIYDTMEGVGEYSYAWNVPKETLQRSIPMEMSLTPIVPEGDGPGSIEREHAPAVSRMLSELSLGCPDPNTRGVAGEMRVYANHGPQETLRNLRADVFSSSEVQTCNIQPMTRYGQALLEVSPDAGSGARTRLNSVYIQSSEVVPAKCEEDGDYVVSDRTMH